MKKRIVLLSLLLLLLSACGSSEVYTIQTVKGSEGGTSVFAYVVSTPQDVLKALSEVEQEQNIGYFLPVSTEQFKDCYYCTVHDTTGRIHHLDLVYRDGSGVLQVLAHQNDFLSVLGSLTSRDNPLILVYKDRIYYALIGSTAYELSGASSQQELKISKPNTENRQVQDISRKE